LTEDAQGAIWIGTSRGVTRIVDPERLGTELNLSLKITQKTLGGVPLVPDQTIEMTASAQPLELRWEVPIFTNRQGLHTRYRLHGRDDAWTDINRNELRYAGLEAGRYNLELVAVNDDLGSSSPPQSLAFTITPPWWRSPAAFAAAFAVLLLLAHAGHRWRVRRLLQRQAEMETQMQQRMRDLEERKLMGERLEESRHLLRELAARNEDAREDERRSLKREIHDELGQHLAALRLGISVIDMQLGQANSPLREKTRSLIGAVDATIKVVRNVVAALRPSALDLGVVPALEWLAQEFTERTGIHCEVQVPAADVRMDDKRATAVLRIVQESLTNVVRHAHASNVLISLQQHHGHYVLEVRDNGQGFDPSVRKEKSFGLVGMRERALMLGGDLFLSSEPGRTSLRVQFPM
jgi:signal transduction histidine kinase